MLLFELDHTLEERNAQKRWFAALPRKTNLVTGLRSDVLANEGFKHLVAHAIIVGCLAVEVLFLQVIAVSAIQVADRPMGLGHDVERLHWSRFPSCDCRGRTVRKKFRTEHGAGLAKFTLSLASGFLSGAPASALNCLRGDRSSNKQ